MFGFHCLSTQPTKEFGVKILRGSRSPLLANSEILAKVDGGLAIASFVGRVKSQDPTRQIWPVFSFGVGWLDEKPNKRLGNVLG